MPLLCDRHHVAGFTALLAAGGYQCLKCVESQMPRCGCVKPISQERNLQAVTMCMAAITDCDRNCSLRV